MASNISYMLLLIGIIANFVLLQSTIITNDIIVVAKDDSGHFKTVTEAVNAASMRAGRRVVIRVRKGVYEENVVIGSDLKNLRLVGEGMGSTIITGSKSNGTGVPTFSSATVAVEGYGFIGQGITFRNTAGPANHQAVAVRVSSDRAVFYQCSFEGYQDTLYVHLGHQFYRECTIYGTVDFIFGDASAVFQDCSIQVRRPLPSQECTITAQGRLQPNLNTGIVIQKSRITAAPDLKPFVSQFKTYIGRPWKQYSRVVVMESYMDSMIDPAGWLEWDGSFGLDTLFYAEYNNTGPGSSTSRRVQWKGYRVITNASEANDFSVANFLAGNSWLPATHIPFSAGL